MHLSESPPVAHKRTALDFNRFRIKPVRHPIVTAAESRDSVEHSFQRESSPGNPLQGSRVMAQPRYDVYEQGKLVQA